MNTKDWSRMVGSDTSPRVPEEFVRYDENGTVRGSSYVITATTQTITDDDVAVPKLSATDIANIANAIKEKKSVSIYDATTNTCFIPMIVDCSETAASVVIVIFHPFVVVEYLLTEGDSVSVKIYKLNMRT